LFLGSASGIADGDGDSADTTLESDLAWAYFGGSVASAGDVNDDGYDDVIVGAPAYRNDAEEYFEGAAFVFLGSASGIADGDASTADAMLESNQGTDDPEGDPVGAYLGTSVAGAGDVNADGYDDVIVGAPGYTAGESFEGAAFVFLGSASGIADGDPTTAAAQLESDQADASLGGSVASAGDVNHDGYDDVIVGAAYYDAGETDEGAAFVFLGSGAGIADGDPGTAAAQLESDQADATLTSVAGAGDVNRDDYDDVIIGAPFYDAGETNEGAAFVFLGGGSGIVDGDPGTASAQLETDQAFVGASGVPQFGLSVAGAGDVNSDGYDDVIVGAPDYRQTGFPAVPEGATFVFLGSALGVADGDPGTAYAHLDEGDPASFAFGQFVAGAGDVNGDGAPDVLVAGPDLPGGNDVGGGLSFMYHGDPDSDGDAVLAATDNCLSRANSSQIDSDSDGFGNHCDADFNQNGLSESSDFSIFKNCYMHAVPHSGPTDDPTCAESDMNGNTFVDSSDFSLFKAEYFTTPGP
jgi:hypothetical protein